eukprot:jgi/Psemu1/15767/gm1.15767_g
MTAVESCETFTPSKQTAYMFLNIGMLSHEDTEFDGSSLSSSTISLASTYDSSNIGSYDDVPDVVPRTDQHPDNIKEEQPDGGVNPYWILLDSESYLNLIVNPDLVTNIQQAPSGGLMNIHCNSGVSKTNLIADLPGFDVVWFYTDGLANVLSLALVSDQYQVTMDTSIDNAIYVHKDGGTRRFQRSKCNLYYYMQETLGFPTSHELIKTIDNKIIKDCPITRRDIKIMTDVYGKHASILKGKSVRKQAPHTREDMTPIPNSVRKAVAINSMKHHTLAKTIRAIAGQYSLRGLHITQIHADNQFECIRDSLLDMEYPIIVHCVPARQHEPTIKRSNRTLKENIRCVVNHIPITRLPCRCLIELVYATVFWLSCRTTGESLPMSAQELMTGMACNARTHDKFPFLKYIQAHCKDTNNTMKPRTLTEGFYAYGINTGQQIHRKRATAIPMPQVVIDKLEANALEQGMPTELEFKIEQPITILDLDTEDNQDVKQTGAHDRN